MTDKKILGEYLIATLTERNYYTRTLNESMAPPVFVPNTKMKITYNLILDYGIPEISFIMGLDKESLKSLADFINNYLEKNK